MSLFKIPGRPSNSIEVQEPCPKEDKRLKAIGAEAAAFLEERGLDANYSLYRAPPHGKPVLVVRGYPRKKKRT